MSQSISNLAIGSFVVFGKYSVNGESPLALIWKIVGTQKDANGQNAVVLLSTQILDIRSFDAAEPNNPDNARSKYGNNRYRYSNINQWLNSTADAGEWYSAQHSYDQAPDSSGVVNHNTQYADRPGFLSYFTTGQRSVIRPAKVRVALSTQDGGGYEDITMQVFLPSSTELGLGNEGGTQEGSTWEAFVNGAAVTASTANAVINNTLSDNKPPLAQSWYYWLRSPVYSQSYSTRMVNKDGTLAYTAPISGDVGVRPAILLSSSLSVSDTTNIVGAYNVEINEPPPVPKNLDVPPYIYGGKTATISWSESIDLNGDAVTYSLQRRHDDGTYIEVYRGSELSYTDNIEFGWSTVQYKVGAFESNNPISYIVMTYTESAVRDVINNYPPIISGTDENLGTKSDGFSQEYTITDSEGEKVSVTEAVDGVEVRSYMATLSQSNTFDVTGATWLTLSNGSHTMTITATDSYMESVVRTYTFTKSVDSFSIQNTVPYDSDVRPSRIKISVTRNIPAEASFNVFVCNNGFDESPTWEEATGSVTGGLVHVFENETKTADAWGVIVKVEVHRLDAQGACYVSQIGGNFE